MTGRTLFGKHLVNMNLANNFSVLFLNDFMHWSFFSDNKKFPIIEITFL